VPRHSVYLAGQVGGGPYLGRPRALYAGGYRELVSLGHICEYCTSVHVITFLLFGLLVYDASGSRAAARTAPAVGAT
jgi:hypothetical protein